MTKCPDKPTSASGNKVRKATLLLSSVIVSILILELGLRALTPFPIHGPLVNRIPHEALGYVLSQGLPYVDKDGFRNPHADSYVDIVTLGDSHTYGVNVPFEHSWPYQLADMTGLSVYNYGVGGYGILEYAYLFDEALKKRPRYILVGLYLPNDLEDYCDLATSDYWFSALRTANLDGSVCLVNTSHRSDSVGLRKRLEYAFIHRTATGSIIRHIQTERFHIVPAGLTGTRLDIGGHPLFISDDRLKAHSRQMDLRYEATSAAASAARHLFKEMAVRAGNAGVGFGVLLIPSQERVLFQIAQHQAVSSHLWSQCVENENALVRDFQAFFRRHGVSVVDAFPFVQKAFDRTIAARKPFYPFMDGHPFTPGYKAYAEAARKLLRSVSHPGRGY